MKPRNGPRSSPSRVLKRSEWNTHETLSPQIFASHSERCRIAGYLAHCEGGDLSGTADPFDRSGAAGRHFRYRRASRRPAAVAAAWTADRDRQPQRCRHQYRHGLRRSCDARRLYAAALRFAGRDQRDALYQSRFQFCARPRAGCEHRTRAADHGGQSGVSGQDGRGLHRLRQSQSRQDQYGHWRRRRDQPRCRRVVQFDGRHQNGGCAVSRRGAVGDRSALAARSR